MIEQIIHRGAVLLHQKKYAEAVQTLSDALKENPNDTYALLLIGEAELQLEHYPQVKQIIDRGISLQPDVSAWYYLYSRYFAVQGNFTEGKKQIQEAILLDPEDGDYHAYLAHMQLLTNEFEVALHTSEHALSLDAENILALNTRSTALNKLKRHEDANDTLKEALKKDPSNSFTHATLGWNYLENGSTQKALDHFKESLRLDPNSDRAKAGMSEALKSKNWLYRLFLKYQFWMANMGAKYRWIAILGIYFGMKGLRAASTINETLGMVLLPLVYVLSFMIFLTWVMKPVGDLILRLNNYGKHLLTTHDLYNANSTGICLSVSAIGFVIYLISAHPGFANVAMIFTLMILPGSQFFREGKNKVLIQTLIAAIGIFGLLSIYSSFSTHEFMNGYTTVFLLMFIVFQWIYNILATV